MMREARDLIVLQLPNRSGGPQSILNNKGEEMYDLY